MLLLPEGTARADGMTGVIIFAVVYAIVSILAKAKQNAQKGEQQEQQELRQQRRLEQQRQRQPRPAAATRPPRAEGTQTEGARLEDLLRVLTGVPPTGGPVERSRSLPLPSEEEVEERESLEVEEQIQNMETETRRPIRREVDHDEEAEAIVQRRIRAAEERDRSLSRADHAAFDQRIRAVAPDATRVAKPKHPTLRQAIIWREILGPPVALRREEPDQ